MRAGRKSRSRKTGRTGEREGVDVLAVVAAGHELLAKTDGVLALGDVVEDLELLLGNALCAESTVSTNRRTLHALDTHTLGEVHLEGEDADVLWTRGRLDLLAGGGVERDGHGGCVGRRAGASGGFCVVGGGGRRRRGARC